LPVIDFGQTWTFSFMCRNAPRPREEGNLTNGNGTSVENQYENAIHTINDVSNTQEFWAIYSHLARARSLPINSDSHLFRRGVKPLWEDPSNALGGKWMIRLRKGLASRLWEHLVIALLGDQFSSVGNHEICGAVLSIRNHEDIISVWNRDASDESAKSAIKDILKKVLMLPPATVLEYKAHNQSLKDNSSFRNTDKTKL
jgi:translation initiation factor 4E